MSDFGELIKSELKILREKYLFATDETTHDPVFDGMLRSFNSFESCLNVLLQRIMI